MNPKEYYVDIDDTICSMPTAENGMPDYGNAIPCERNIALINALYQEGNNITYWTSRGSKTGINWRRVTEDQLKAWGCLYHTLRLDKPYYDMFFDDKTHRLPEIK